MSLEVPKCHHLGVLIPGALLTMIPVIKLQVIPNICTKIFHCIEADVLVKITSHALKSIDDVGEVGVDGWAGDITQGISRFLGYAVEGIVRIVGEARAEGLEQFILDERIKLAEEAVVEEIVFGLNVMMIIMQQSTSKGRSTSSNPQSEGSASCTDSMIK